MMGEPRRHRRAAELLWLVSVALVVCAIAWVLARIAPDWRWSNHPVHALVEGLGAFAALTVVFLLSILLRFNVVSPRYTWVACALISMGILDAFHAATHAGPLFIWLHSLAQLTGGIFFLGVVLPAPSTSLQRFRLLGMVAILTTLVGIGSVVLPGIVPTMQEEGHFTLVARALNLTGGVGFIVAAIVLAWDAWDVWDEHRRLFAGHCVLFGVSGLIFEQSRLWDGTWWLWHALRLFAYGLVFGLVLRQLYQTQKQLAATSLTLEKAVADKTLAMQEEVNRRREKEGAYHALAVLHEKRALDLERLQFATLNIAEDARMERERAILRTEELREVNAELDQFAYVASHDLKAPLRAIEKLALWIQEDADEVLPEVSKRHLSTLRQRIVRMRALLDDLLAYSRAGRSKGSITKVNSDRVVREVIDFIDPPAGVEIEIEGTLPTLESYLVPFELVMRNLISNGVKHLGGVTGKLAVSAREEGEFIAFSVADNGPGVAEEFRERIFVMFQTLAPRDEVEGTGMGLAIVKKILDSEGGRIIVGESSLGGAEFTFWWPRRSQPESSNHGQ